VLFVDEIHRLPPVVEEVLYPALEDFQIDIMIGEGPSARSLKLDLPPFTLIGAHHARGPSDLAAARPLRHRAAARVLQPRGARRDRAALGPASSTSPASPTAPTRSRAARRGTRASRTGCCAAARTLPRSKGQRS
jgi:hypothetical protein